MYIRPPQLDEFRSKPAEEIKNIQKALQNLAEWKDKVLQLGDVDSVKNAISKARNAAMKIGQAMNNQQSGQSSSDNANQSNESEQQSGEDKKN